MWLSLFLFPVFMMGASLGSFLSVLVDRLSTGRPFVTGRSYCESCKKTLKAIDLVPILSYAMLLGRCRYCKKRIPFRLFTVELTSAILATGFFYFAIIGSLGLLQAALLFLLLYFFLGIFVADIVYGIIPDLFSVVTLIISLAYVFLLGQPLMSHALSGLGCLLFFLLLFMVTKGKGMGFGDVKLSFILGFLLGFPLIIVSLYLAFLTGAVVAIILVVCRKTKFFGGAIPFGPFLVASTVISLFYGQKILTAFLMRFFP